MTIKDIANAAGVSISTVSKILNHKDEGITEDTRLKVLAIVNEKQYVPYSKIRDKIIAQSGTVGVVLPEAESPFYASFLQWFLQSARDAGLLPLLVTTGYSPQQERQAIDSLLDKRVSSIMLAACSPESAQASAERVSSKASLLLINYHHSRMHCQQLYCNYEDAAFRATGYLLTHGCRRVALMPDGCNAYTAQRTQKGYRRALQNHFEECDKGLIIDSTTEVEQQLHTLFDFRVEALVCQTIAGARQALEVLNSRFLSVPQDISVMVLEDSPLAGVIAAGLTTFRFPIDKMASDAVKYLVKQTTGNSKTAAESISYTAELVERGSVALPEPIHTEKIMVVGWLNMDINLKVPHGPSTDKLLPASNLNCLPGGKGSNQAVGVAKFGGSAHMLGVLGNDVYGRQLHEQLLRAGVDASGVSFDSKLPTGTAYILRTPDGNSFIVGNAGANSLLNTEYVESHRDLFAGAAYCLTQAELGEEALRLVISICEENQVKIILKPSPAIVLDSELSHKIEVIVPSVDELRLMTGVKGNIESGALQLLRQGCTHVVVTLGDRGCLWAHGDVVQYFNPEKVHCVDATGASDIFISCLAVMLAEGYEMERAVAMSNYAASLSVTREGVQNAIPDRRQVECRFEQYEGNA